MNETPKKYFDIDDYLKIAGFQTPKWNIAGTTRLERIFKGYLITFDGNKFCFFKTSTTALPVSNEYGFVRECENGCFAPIGFDNIAHKECRKTILLCKALNEIRKTEWNIPNYEIPIIRMVASMFFSGKQTAPDTIDSSGNQARVAEDYIKKIRHGEWWEASK